MDNLGDQNDALAPPTTPQKKTTQKRDTPSRNLAQEQKRPLSAATAQGVVFNAGHVGPTAGMLHVMGASVMAVAGVGLIQTKKKNS